MSESLISITSDERARLSTGVVCRTDAIECFFENRESDTLFVTFNEMGMTADGSNYWCSAPAKNLNISIFAFVSTSPNWFPASDMRRCLDTFWSCMAESPHTRVVAIGLSQGAYAVIKYGRMLGVHLAISFSPQFSIDPSDLDDFRFKQFFDPMKHKSMKIEERDVPSGCYLFYDPYDKLDADHASKIENIGTFESFPLPYAGHGSVRVFLGTDNLWNLIKACFDSDTAGIRSLYGKLKRLNSERPWLIAIKIARKRPKISLQILEKYGADKCDARWLHVCWQLSEAGLAHLVIGWIEQFLAANPEHEHGLECLCLVSIRLGDKDTAIKVAEQLVREDPENTRKQHHLKWAKSIKSR